MKKAIVKDGKTTIVDLTSEEISEREAAYEAALAAEADEAPYNRLKELDEIISRNTEEIAILTGRKLTQKEQAAKDEKESIRASLK